MNLDNSFDKIILLSEGVKLAGLFALRTGNHILPAHICQQVGQHLSFQTSERKNGHYFCYILRFILLVQMGLDFLFKLIWMDRSLCYSRA